MPLVQWILSNILTIFSIVILTYFVIKLFQYPVYLDMAVPVFLNQRPQRVKDISRLIETNELRRARKELFTWYRSVQIPEDEKILIPPSSYVQFIKGNNAAGFFGLRLTELFVLTNKRLILFPQGGFGYRNVWKKGFRTKRTEIFSSVIQLECKTSSFSETLESGEAYPNVTVEIYNYGWLTMYHPRAREIHSLFMTETK